MDAPEVRLSPDRRRVAIRLPDHNGLWTTTAGPMLVDADVREWTPLRPASAPDRVTCPWCKKPDRKLTSSGAIRKHGKPNTFPPQDCEGSGRTLADFQYLEDLRRIHQVERMS